MKRFCNIVFILVVFIFAIYFINDIFRVPFLSEVYDKAVKNNPEEQLRLAQLYHQGVFTEVNLEEARRWYRKAAKNGNQIAIDILDWEFNERSTQNAR